MSDEDSEDEFEDPSVKKIKDIKLFREKPIKLPGGDMLTAEPEAEIVAAKMLGQIIAKLSDPDFVDSIMDNLTTRIKLSLETAKSKLKNLKKNGLKKDETHEETDSDSDDSDKDSDDSDKDSDKDSDDSDKDSDDSDKDSDSDSDEETKIKGGSISFFTKKECSFF